MSKGIETRLRDIVPFNPVSQEPRIPVVLLVDTSDSMSEHILHVNQMVPTILDAIRKDVQARRMVEIALVAFSDDAKVVHDFALVGDWIPGDLSTAGRTAMGKAIHKALDITERRKEIYKDNGVTYYEPWLILLTDGAPTDDISSAVERLDEYRSREKVVCIPIGIGANADVAPALKALSERAVKMRPGGWTDMVPWLIENFEKRSRSGPDDRFILERPDVWGEPI